jgi:rRNA maturation RNase YbeY
MIQFNYENDFLLENEKVISDWILKVLSLEGFKSEEISFIFCDDAYLHKLNVQYLNHDTLTDIISFDNSLGKVVSGDIFISTERVAENAETYHVTFQEELHRVIIHGVLHFMGYKDKTESDSMKMRQKENESLTILSN